MNDKKSTHSEVGEMDLLNWLNSKVQSLNKSNSFYGYVNNVYKDQFEKEFSEWINEYLTPTKPVEITEECCHLSTRCGGLGKPDICNDCGEEL